MKIATWRLVAQVVDLVTWESRLVMSITPESFQWIGGRYKLADPESDAISLLKGDIIVAETYKRLKHQKLQVAEERKYQRLLKKQRQLLVDFLNEHGFDQDDVNAVGGNSPKSCFNFLGGLKYEQPLHRAVKEGHVAIVELLLQFGADPMMKDSKGKTAYYHASSPALKLRMSELRKGYEAHGGSKLAHVWAIYSPEAPIILAKMNENDRNLNRETCPWDKLVPNMFQMQVISNPLPRASENPGVTCLEGAESVIAPKATLECEATRNEVWFALYSYR